MTSGGLVTASYATDEGLLAELRTAWPPGDSPLGGSSTRGYVAADLGNRTPDAAIRLGDRFAVALVPDGDAWLPIPLAGFGGRWWRAAPGDGLSAFVAGVPAASERSLGVDQTNDSVVVGERAIVKWFRRVGPGPSRAATLVAHLDAAGFAEIPTPLGSLAWRAPDDTERALAEGAAFLPAARDGWDWVVERLDRHVAHGEADCPADCQPWVGVPLGRLAARLHAALATPSAVIAEPDGFAIGDDVAAWRAAANRLLHEALDLEPAADDGSGPGLRSLEAALRADLARLPLDRPIPVQPVHGDLHVGQVLEWAGGLAVIDFDGNPALGAAANAIRQPVERDVAQLAASLDHVGRVVDHRTTGQARPVIEAWIARTRAELLGQLHADPDRLAAFEAEQELRELVYAARFLPRWRYAPLATLRARYGR